MSIRDILAKKPEDLLVPHNGVQSDALQHLKAALDGVAPAYSPLDEVFVDGLKVDQVWVQAQMVLDGVAAAISAKIDGRGGSSEDGSEDDESEVGELGESGPEFSDANELSEEELSEAELSDNGNFENVSDDENVSDSENLGENLDDASDASEDRSHRDGSTEYLSAQEGSDREEQFDLAEFQQHVLRLEQDGSEDDEDVDYNAELPSDDEDMHYSDFFGSAPKAKKAEPMKEPKPKKKATFGDADLWSENEDGEEAEEGEAGEAGEAGEEADDEEVDVHAITQKDLFDSEDDADAGDDAPLSRFEQQQLELAKQIEELEAENMGEKDWGMRGEAKAKDRPEDSVFGLQFERGAKPAPVVTEESTASIEDLIRERVRKQRFDDLPRRSELPDAPTKRELGELSDRKSERSLAEQYEEDRLRSENPDYFANQDAAATTAAHAEIVALYAVVSRRLDALSSWAYTPKKAAPTLAVVAEGPSIAMEEAQPGTLGHNAQLAPQEVFRGQETPMDASEMTASLKRKRRREKASHKHAKDPKQAKHADAKHADAKQAGKGAKKARQEAMFDTLKRGNVTMLDGRGERRDMRGEKVKDRVVAASNYKL